jgi:hypothetical protein
MDLAREIYQKKTDFKNNNPKQKFAGSTGANLIGGDIPRGENGYAAFYGSRRDCSAGGNIPGFQRK